MISSWRDARRERGRVRLGVRFLKPNALTWRLVWWRPQPCALAKLEIPHLDPVRVVRHVTSPQGSAAPATGIFLVPRRPCPSHRTLGTHIQDAWTPASCPLQIWCCAGVLAAETAWVHLVAGFCERTSSSALLQVPVSLLSCQKRRYVTVSTFDLRSHFCVLVAARLPCQVWWACLKRLMAMSQPRDDWMPLCRHAKLVLQGTVYGREVPRMRSRRKLFLTRKLAQLTVRWVSTAAVFVTRCTYVGSRRHLLVLIGRCVSANFDPRVGWRSTLMRFVVGPRCSLENVVSRQRSCTVRRDVLMVVSLAVQTAVSSRFQERMLQEIRLSQFGAQ